MASEYTQAPGGFGFAGNTVIIGGEPRVYLSISLQEGTQFSTWLTIEQAQRLAAHVSLLARKEPERV